MAYFPLNTSATGAIPVLQSLAREFVVCDHWFASIPGPNLAQPLFRGGRHHQGQSAHAGGVATIPTLFRHYDMDTIFNRLHDAGKRSRIYYHDISLSLLLRQTWDIPTCASVFPASLRMRRKRSRMIFLSSCSSSRASSNCLPTSPMISTRRTISARDQLIADAYAALSGNQALWRETLLVVAPRRARRLFRSCGAAVGAAAG